MPFIDPLVLDGVRDVLRAVSSECSLEELEGVLLQAACKAAATPSGVWFRVQPLEGNLPGLEATAAFGLAPTTPEQTIFPADQTTAAGRATLSATSEILQELPSIPHTLVPPGACCEFCIPIVTDGELIGIIDLFSTEPGAFTADVVQSVEALAGLLGPASEIHTKWLQQRQLRHEIVEQDARASFGKLLSAIAHEVNDPLASIFGSASLLELEVPDREHQSSLAVIRKESARASALLRELMAFSKRPTAVPEVIDMRTLVRDVVDIARPILTAQGSKVTIALPDTEFPISVDRVAISQAIFVLLTHSDASGRRVTVVLDAGSDRATLSISDSLADLSDPEEMALAEQLQIGSVSGSFPAVRLAAARSAIAENGGRLKASQGDDAPVRFKFTLPQAAETGALTSVLINDATGLPAAHAPRATVLIVDDEPSVRDMLGNLFRSQRCDVVSARDGEEALVLAKAEVFDVVVSDIRMPRLSGPDFYRKLVEGYGGHYQGKFIFITGDMSSIDEHNRMENLTDLPVMQKPFPPAELLRLADVALPA